MLRRLGIASVMAANALGQVLARTDVAPSGFLAARSNKTRFEYQEFTSGWWDLNPRPPGPEPGAIPSFATARNQYSLWGYAADAPLTSRILVQIARRSNLCQSFGS
jgi:hypothetical protein